IEELQGILQGVRLGEPDSLQDKAKIILSNENIFHINLYEAGVGEKTEDLIKEELAGFGAVRRTLHKYMFE
ncbi:MAG: mannitol dehydrogenase family protein, partial [Lachnospiraceae bacterium]|nr:mannitol dehydrogenase family protein [Lachnospiraceae bacterium]